MCTMIAGKSPLSGSAKGPDGWFPVDHVYVGYDHPFHAPLDHALSIDLVNEQLGVGARVAIELGRDAARDLAHHILDAVEAAERYESGDAAARV